MKVVHKAAFRLRERFRSRIVTPFRKACLRAQGLTVGRSSIPSIGITWPHKVQIGDDCTIEDGVFFKHDGIWSPGKSIVIGDRVFLGRFTEFNISESVHIGDDALIASGCKFIDHNHGYGDLSVPMNRQATPAAGIVLENDVWLGVNVVVLKGVRIGTGAIVGAGSVVTRSIPSREIWGGIPARKIGERNTARATAQSTA